MFEKPIIMLPMLGGLIYMLAGFILIKFPPKKINLLYGYRTLRAMKSQQSWDFAQRFSAMEFIKAGAISAIAAVIMILSDPKVSEIISVMLGFVILFLLLILVLFRTERALKRKFNG